MKGNSFSAKASGTYRLERLLSGMGIPAGSRGFRYLVTAVGLFQQEDGSLTKDIYPATAKIYQSSPKTVESTIRHAVGKAWERGGDDIYASITGIRYEHRPANGQIISELASFIQSGSSAK